jgi:predicted SAM-dependent methyltransferase
MYSKIKSIIIKLLPTGILLRNEFVLRKLYSLFFIGKTVYCTICDRYFSRFLNAFADDKICPRCGSLGRHRRLWQIINHEINICRDDKILDFSPSRMILKKLKAKHSNYLSTDYLENMLVDRHYDITKISEPSDSFHWIICYHVLEHIPDDFLAMSELYRILKKEGCAIIQTPFKNGDIYENAEIISDDDRLLHFGQEDHVRIYSVKGLKERLQSVGFKVKILKYREDDNNIHGFKAEEHILIATK